jgi:hypothetical protein
LRRQRSQLGIIGLKRDEETAGWRKRRKEELHDLYSSPDILRIMQPRRMRYTRNVASVGEKRNADRSLWESQKKEDH